MRRCDSKDGGPRRGVDLVGVPHQLDKGISASKDAGPKGSHIGGGGERNTLYKDVKTPP